MERNKHTFVLGIAICFILAGIAFSTGPQEIQPSPNPDLEQYEELGLEFNADVITQSSANPSGNPAILLDSLPDSDVLLIPNSTDDWVGMYDPFDGDYLGIFVEDSIHFSTPLCAIEGPDGNIYISDQIGDGVFVYDRQGTYIVR